MVRLSGKDRRSVACWLMWCFEECVEVMAGSTLVTWVGDEN